LIIQKSKSRIVRSFTQKFTSQQLKDVLLLPAGSCGARSMFYQGLILAEGFIARVYKFDTFPLHWHGEIEIIHCLTGSFSMVIDGHNFALTAGQTVFVASAKPHEYTSVTEGTECLIIEMGAGLLKQNFVKLAERDFENPVMKAAPREIKNLFKTIVRELKQTESTVREWIVTGCLFELAAIILRDFSGKIDLYSQRYQRIYAMQRMGDLLEYVQLHYHEKITIEDASMRTPYEKSNFCKNFKKATQMTFHQYLNMIRIGKACIILKGSDDPIGVIAEKCGFPEAKTFSRVFREFMKKTPGQYRKE
jgi:AraC-like DNA-binding protein/mannose-6-phosphate isomerase-like protein (cupin superfamily)